MARHCSCTAADWRSVSEVRDDAGRADFVGRRAGHRRGGLSVVARLAKLAHGRGTAVHRVWTGVRLRRWLGTDGRHTERAIREGENKFVFLLAARGRSIYAGKKQKRATAKLSAWR